MKKISVQLQFDPTPSRGRRVASPGARRRKSSGKTTASSSASSVTTRSAAESRACEFLRSLADGPGASLLSCEVGRDEGGYATAVLASEDMAALWGWIEARLERGGLRGAAIVACEGEQGWADYLLLHHFDPAQTLDSLS